jgi:Ca2+-binding RTX toxin-like protein
MKPRMLAATAVCAVAAIGAPAVAQANDTITYSGTTLVFSGNGDAAVDVIASDGDTTGTIQFYEYTDNQTITDASGNCQASNGYMVCPVPSAMQVNLTSFDDQWSNFDNLGGVPMTVTAGAGNDTVKDDYDNRYSTGRTFDGGPGNDTLEGYQGPDTLIGGTGDDEVDGGAGADTVRGGDGNDTLEGDKYETAAPDVIDGGPGFDIMEEYSIPSNDVNPPATVTQDGVANDGRPGENDNVTSVEKITSHVNGTYNGTTGDDDINVWANTASGASTIRGLAGNDKLTGSDYGSDAIDGGPGDDTIQGGFDNDTIVGGPGRDKINSDGGSYCGLYECNVPFGDDTIDVRDGEVDQVECGIGNDTVYADSIDSIAPSCENVTRTGGTPGGGGGNGGGGNGGHGGGGSQGAPKLALPHKLKLATLRKRGLTFKLTCAAACRVTGDLYKGSKKVGHGTRSLLGAGQAKVKVKLSKQGRKRVGAHGKPKLTLRVKVTDAAGKTQSLKKKLRFR